MVKERKTAKLFNHIIILGNYNQYQKAFELIHKKSTKRIGWLRDEKDFYSFISKLNKDVCYRQEFVKMFVKN